MASIAETLSACMTFLALVQRQFPPYSVSDDFLSDLSQKLPMMKAHIRRSPDAGLVLWIGFVEKRLSGSGLLCKETRSDTVSERDQHNHYRNGYEKGVLTAGWSCLRHRGFPFAHRSALCLPVKATSLRSDRNALRKPWQCPDRTDGQTSNRAGTSGPRAQRPGV